MARPAVLAGRTLADTPGVWAAMRERDAIYADPAAGEKEFLHAAELEAKYAEYGKVSAGDYTEVTGLYPRRVLAWTSFPTDVTRFVFPSQGKGS